MMRTFTCRPPFKNVTERSFADEHPKEPLSEIDELRIELEKKFDDKFKAQKDEFKNELNKLNTKMAGIRFALQPAATHALMETGVRLSVEQWLEKHEVQKQRDAVFHRCEPLGGQFLKAILKENEAKRQKIPFSLKSKHKFPRSLTKDEIDDLRIRILRGLRAFVRSVNRCVDNWPPDINPLMHNGKLLDALFNPTKTIDLTFTEETMEKIRQVLEHNAKDSKRQLDNVENTLKESLGNEIAVYDYDELCTKLKNALRAALLST